MAHRPFNHGILLERADRDETRRLYPLIVEVLIRRKLIARFKPAYRVADGDDDLNRPEYSEDLAT